MGTYWSIEECGWVSSAEPAAVPEPELVISAPEQRLPDEEPAVPVPS